MSRSPRLAESCPALRSTGAALATYLIFGVLFAIPLAISLAALWRTMNAWPACLIFALMWLGVLVCIAALRLEISETGFRYRTILRRRCIAFADIEQVYFEGEHSEHTPMRVARFIVQTKDGARNSVSLKPFPLVTVAALFDALESNQIPLKEPDFWHAQYLLKQIRQQQQKNKPRSA